MQTETYSLSEIIFSSDLRSFIMDDTIILQYYACKKISRCGLKTYFMGWLFMYCICTVFDVYFFKLQCLKIHMYKVE